MERSQESPGFLFVWRDFFTAEIVERAKEKENRIYCGLYGERFLGQGG